MLRRPSLIAAAAVTAAALLCSWLLLIRDGVHGVQALLSSAGPSLLFGVIGLAARYPCRALPLREGSLGRTLIAHAGGAIVASGIWLASWKVWLPAVGGQIVRTPLIFTFGIGALLYAGMVTVHYLLLQMEASQQAEEAALRYQVLARQAELKAFKAQLDPHFLFNSLNAVASLCGSRPADARQMAQLMADFFRQTLRVASLERIPLSQEIELISKYLAIEKVRFGDRLEVQVDIDAAAQEWQIPPLILQPLVENAVRHGIASVVSGGRIAISAAAAEGRLRISIVNPADPDRPQASGERIGLQNARGRLAAVTGGRGMLRTEESSGSYRVLIEVPA